MESSFSEVSYFELLQIFNSVERCRRDLVLLYFYIFEEYIRVEFFLDFLEELRYFRSIVAYLLDQSRLALTSIQAQTFISKRVSKI